MFSYWEQQSFTNYHYVVVGGGLVGLSTALSLKELHPQASILILERGVIPSGASTRNAGFACFGSLTELLSDIAALGEKGAQQLVADRWLGLQMLRERIGDDLLGYQCYGGYELLFTENLESLEALERVNDILHPVFNQQVFSTRSELIDQFGFNQERVIGLVENPLEGQLHAGKMMRSLMNLATAQGIDYLTGATVKNFEITPDGVCLNVSSVDPEPIRFKAQRVTVCTNAFTHPLLPKLDIQPGRGIVLITKPLKNLKFKGVFHYKQGYYYFRNVGSRVLFGGGRDLDMKGEETTDFGINDQILEHLQYELSHLILPDQDFEIDSIWSGIMAFGKDKTPLVGLHSPEVGYAVRLGGMGVALGSLVGARLARLICLNAENV